MVGVTTAWGAALEGALSRLLECQQRTAERAAAWVELVCREGDWEMCSWELSACFPMGTGNKEGKIYCNSYFLPSTITSLIPSSIFTVSVAVRDSDSWHWWGSITTVLNQVLGSTVLPPLLNLWDICSLPGCYKALAGMEGAKTEWLTALSHQLSLAPSAVLGCGKTLFSSTSNMCYVSPMCWEAQLRRRVVRSRHPVAGPPV